MASEFNFVFPLRVMKNKTSRLKCQDDGWTPCKQIGWNIWDFGIHYPFFFIHPRSWRIALRTWSCFNAFWKRENKFIILYVYIFRREATSVLIVWPSQNHSFVDAMENLTPLFDIIPSLYVIFTQSAWPLVICLFSIRQQ